MSLLLLSIRNKLAHSSYLLNKLFISKQISLLLHKRNITLTGGYLFKMANNSNASVDSTNQSFRTLETLNFDNLVLRTLPIDPIKENYVREVKNACFSKVRKQCFFFSS